MDRIQLAQDFVQWLAFVVTEDLVRTTYGCLNEIKFLSIRVHLKEDLSII